MDDQILVIQTLVDSNKQITDELKQVCGKLKNKLNKSDFELSEIKALLNKVLVQNQNCSPENMDSPQAHDPVTVVLDKSKSPLLSGGNSKKLPKLYELLIRK